MEPKESKRGGSPSLASVAETVNSFSDLEDLEEEDGDEDDDDEEGESEDDGEEGDEEEEETEEEIDSDNILSNEEPPESPFQWYPSEEDFKGSDLQSRKKRRYLLGTHSFLELVDPKLENALVPAGQEEENLSPVESTRPGLKAERDLYKDLCKKAGVPPNATFLRSLGKSLLDLTYHGLSEKEIEMICTTLFNDKFIEVCLLKGNCAGRLGGVAIAGMIANNYTIEELDIANTEIIETIEDICEAMRITTTLVSLDLSKNELNDQDMSLIGSMLAENQSLKRLYLSSNEIKDPGLWEIGAGLEENHTLNLLDLSRNRIKGERRGFRFFAACVDHGQLRHLDLSRNIIRDEGAKGIARILAKNDRLQFLDASVNIMEEPSGVPLGRALNIGKRDLEILRLEQQWWHQQAAAAVLAPFGRRINAMPIELIDFGYMLDIHKRFINARDKALRVHPDLRIIHGLPYGMNKAKGPDPKALVIRRAKVICDNFETPLVMLMEELAKEPKQIKSLAFKKFIKSCNLYKDKSLTDSFEKVFTAGPSLVDAEAILEAFDKEYPGVRKIPGPLPEGEKKSKDKKKKKGKKGKKGTGKGKRKGKSKGKGKGKSKSPTEKPSKASKAKSQKPKAKNQDSKKDEEKCIN